MDFDGDGNDDIISGSYMPGELFVFKGNGDGTFAAGEAITDASGDKLLAGSGPTGGAAYDTESLASVPFATDWDDDGDLDLLVGNIVGQVILIRNDGTREHPRYGAERTKLKAGGEEITVPHGDSGPIMADWNDDGLLDLISGAGDGSVLMYENVGAKGSPRFKAPVWLVGAKQSDEDAANMFAPLAYGQQPTKPGLRTKVCATDFDGDGKLDLLVGDFALTSRPEPELTDAQRQRRDELLAEQTAQQARMQEIFRRLAEEHGDAAMVGFDYMSDDEFRELQEKMSALYQELNPLQAGQDTHGWVWVYRRK